MSPPSFPRNSSTLIDNGLSSDAAKVWDETEKRMREEHLKKSLSQLHNKNHHINATGVVSVSIDEDSDGSFYNSHFDDDSNDNGPSSSSTFMHPFASSNSNNISSTNSENEYQSHVSNVSSDICPKEPPTPYTPNTNLNMSASDSSNHFVMQAEMQSLELQLAHLQSQNHSLRNTIVRDRHTLEQLSFSNSRSVEELQLLKAHFQHLLPPPSSASDPSLSTSTHMLPTIPELRGQALHQTKIELDETQQKLRSALDQVERIEQQSKDNVLKLTSQNTALQTQIKSLDQKLIQQSHLNNHSQRQILNQSQDQIRIEKYLEQQVNMLQGQMSILVQDLDERKTREQEYIQSISNFQRTQEEYENQITSLSNQTKKDQSEIAALLEERNAVRGQLDEIQSNSYSKETSDSLFQKEIDRLQTSHTKAKNHLQEQLSSLQLMHDEKAKLLKEAKINEASSLNELQELKKGCNLLVQTLLRLEHEQLLFGAKHTMSVRDMVEYAWNNANNVSHEEFLDGQISESHVREWDEKRKKQTLECLDASIQTSHIERDIQSTGTITDDEITHFKKEQQQLHEQISSFTNQNKTLNESNQSLQQQLQRALSQSQGRSGQNRKTDIQIYRLTQEKNTLLKSKEYIQEENRKLVEKRVEVQRLLSDSEAEKAHLKEKMNEAKNNLLKECKSYEGKIEKLKKEMDHIGKERDYWERTAGNLDKKLKMNEISKNEYEALEDVPTATVSFDVSTQASIETDKGSLAFDLPMLKASKQFTSRVLASRETADNVTQISNSFESAIQDSKLQIYEKEMKEMKTVLAEKETIIKALTEHLTSQSPSFTDPSTSPTMDNPVIPLEQWLEQWESTMDNHVNETAEIVTEALSSALRMLADDVVLAKKEKDIVEEKKEDVLEESMDDFLTNMASNMTREIQQGLEMILNHDNNNLQEGKDHQKDGELLQAKLKQLLQTLDEQQNVIKNQEVALNAMNQSQQSLLVADKSNESPVMSTKSTNCKIDSSDQEVQAGSGVADSRIETDVLQDKLNKLLENIENHQTFIGTPVRFSDVSTTTDIVPGMVNQGVNTLEDTKKISNFQEVSIQTTKDIGLGMDDINLMREQLSKALSQCSQLQTEKNTLETALSKSKHNFESKLHKIRQGEEDEVKLLKLNLDSNLPLKRDADSVREDNDRALPQDYQIEKNHSIQDRLYRIRQSAERAALFAKHEEEQSRLISECNAALRKKMDSFNDEVNIAVEKNMAEAKKDRDKFVQFACTELKKEYNDRIEKLLRRHQQEIEQMRMDDTSRNHFDEQGIRSLEEKHLNSTKKSESQLDSKYNTLKSIMKLKQDKRKFSSAHEKNQRKSVTLGLTEKDKYSSRGKSESLITTPFKSEFFVDQQSAVDSSISPLHCNIATNLFHDEFDDDASDHEESFQDVEEFVASVLNDCDATKQLNPV